MCTIFLASAMFTFMLIATLQMQSIGFLDSGAFGLSDNLDLDPSFPSSVIGSTIEFSREAVEMSMQEFAEIFEVKAKFFSASKYNKASKNFFGNMNKNTTEAMYKPNTIEKCFVAKTTWNADQVI